MKPAVHRTFGQRKSGCRRPRHAYRAQGKYRLKAHMSYAEAERPFREVRFCSWQRHT